MGLLVLGVKVQKCLGFTKKGGGAAATTKNQLSQDEEGKKIRRPRIYLERMKRGNKLPVVAERENRAERVSQTARRGERKEVNVSLGVGAIGIMRPWHPAVLRESGTVVCDETSEVLADGTLV